MVYVRACCVEGHPLHTSLYRSYPSTATHLQNGFNILIEVHRISAYYVITFCLPILINTNLALLVFSVSPRHLDTRLGIVVTLFL